MATARSWSWSRCIIYLPLIVRGTDSSEGN